MRPRVYTSSSKPRLTSEAGLPPRIPQFASGTSCSTMVMSFASTPRRPKRSTTRRYSGALRLERAPGKQRDFHQQVVVGAAGDDVEVLRLVLDVAYLPIPLRYAQRLALLPQVPCWQRHRG